MFFVLGCIITLFVVFLIYKSEKASTEIKNPSDYLSFGTNLSESDLQKTFEASNSSFTTAFVSLFTYAFIYGIYAVGVPIGFCFGIVFYVYVLLPLKMEHLAQGHRYPQILGNASNSRSVRIVSSLFIIISLWLFTFAEVQGFNIILKNLFELSDTLAFFIPIIVIGSVAYYVGKGGFKAILMTDQIQMILIYIGSATILGISIVGIYQIGFDNFFGSDRIFNNPFNSKIEVIFFLGETVIGFLFSQLLYFDNWHRLSFYVQESVKNNVSLTKLEKTIRKTYLIGALILGIIYIIPIFWGYSLVFNGENNGDISVIASQLSGMIDDFPILGLIACSIIIIQFAAALLSTADTYAISAVNTVFEDVFDLPIESNNNMNHLYLMRAIAIFFVLSTIVISFFEPNFENLFFYMFYSANGFVGPIIFSLKKREINPLAIYTSILFGFIYPFGSFYIPLLSDIFVLPGIITVLFSILITWIYSKKRS